MTRRKVKVQKEAQNQFINMLHSECILLTFPNIFVQHLPKWYSIKRITVSVFIVYSKLLRMQILISFYRDSKILIAMIYNELYRHGILRL